MREAACLASWWSRTTAQIMRYAIKHGLVD